MIVSQASENEIIWVIRISTIFVGAFACTLAIIVESVYGLFRLCSDLVYVLLFPQLITVIYVPKSNTYGSLASYIVGLLIRLSGGEPLIGLPALVHFPGYDSVKDQQNFPFRTVAMLSAFIVLVGVSYFTDWLFRSGRAGKNRDVFKCIVDAHCTK